MSPSMSRAQFLHGDLSGRHVALRPPWAVAEARFVDLCTRCNDCADECPLGLLQSGPGGYPVIDFARGGCTFCGACVDACAHGALSERVQGIKQAPWTRVAKVQSQCLSLHGVLCRVCGERCELRAIHFRPVVGGSAMPAIDTGVCNGCGACYTDCPTQAIAFVERVVHPID